MKNLNKILYTTASLAALTGTTMAADVFNLRTLATATLVAFAAAPSPAPTATPAIDLSGRMGALSTTLATSIYDAVVPNPATPLCELAVNGNGGYPDYSFLMHGVWKENPDISYVAVRESLYGPGSFSFNGQHFAVSAQIDPERTPDFTYFSSRGIQGFSDSAPRYAEFPTDRLAAGPMTVVRSMEIREEGPEYPYPYRNVVANCVVETTFPQELGNGESFTEHHTVHAVRSEPRTLGTFLSTIYTNLINFLSFQG